MNLIKSGLGKIQKICTSTKVCSTRMVGDKFFECKVRKPNPNYCEHSLCSGDSFICNHPDRAKFAKK